MQQPGLASPERARSALLDLHEGIVPHLDPRAGKCQRWPEHLALLNGSTGELLPGRCRATNLCRYCQTLYVVETVEMLTLDALEFSPSLWIVLTAREHLTRAECRKHLDHLRRALRKRWPGIEWFVQVEFQRRGALHLNLLIKGVPLDDQEQLLELASTIWCKRVDALPRGQWAGAIADGEGVVKYLAKTLSHGLKNEQAPPIGWRGHRTSQTRGYLVRPASVMREEARRALRVKRRIWRGDDAATAELEVAAAELHEWELRGVNPSSAGTGRVRPRRAGSAPLRESTRGNPGGKVAGASGRPPLPGSIDQEEEHDEGLGELPTVVGREAVRTDDRRARAVQAQG